MRWTKWIKAASYMPDWVVYLKNAPAGLWLDLGCGESKPDGFIGIDKSNADVEADLEKGIPYPDTTGAVIRASHVLEHLVDKEAIMQEIWRVLIPGGLLIGTVPSTKSEGAFAHPDHKSYWNKSSFAFWTNAELAEDRPCFQLLELKEHYERGLVYVDFVLRKPKITDKRIIKPITRLIVLPKPAMKIHGAQTEAFRVEELKPWLDKHLPNGVQVEEKLNGFRTLAQKRGDTVSIFFEDAKKERSGNLKVLSSDLSALQDDFIIDGDIGIEKDGKRLARINLIALTGKEVKLPSGWKPVLTAFDVLYTKQFGGDVHEKPLKERRAILEKWVKAAHIAELRISEKRIAQSMDDVKKAWSVLGKRDMSEGIVLKDLESPYPLSPATQDWAKVKHDVEIKGIVIEKKRNRNGTWNLRAGLLKGDSAFPNTIKFEGKEIVDLGFSFNTPLNPKLGEVVTFRVEELFIDGKGNLGWVAARSIDIDKERKNPYFANQAIDIAKRARVFSRAIQKKEQTRGEAAFAFFDKHWQELFPASGEGRFLYQHHWRGLEEEETKLSDEQLMKTANSIHGDLRLETDAGAWGVATLLGRAKDNDGKKWNDKFLDFEKPLRAEPKQLAPKEILKIKDGKTTPPGEFGATAKAWAKFFNLDKGKFQIGVWKQNFLELFMKGEKLKGRLLIELVPFAGEKERVWLVNRPEDQTPFAESHDLEKEIADQKKKGRRWLVWAKPGVQPQLIDLKKAKSEELFTFIEKREEQQIVVGPVLVPGRLDLQGEIITEEIIEKAAHKFLISSAKIGVQHTGSALSPKRATIVESWVAKGEERYGDRSFPKGTWFLAVKIFDGALWHEVKSGKLTGFSIQGIARARDLS